MAFGRLDICVSRFDYVEKSSNSAGAPGEDSFAFGGEATTFRPYSGGAFVVWPRRDALPRCIRQKAVWHHATHRHRLVAQDLERRIIAYNTWRFVATLLIFLLSIGIAFWNPLAAMYSWALLAVVRPVLLRIFHRRRTRPGHPDAAHGRPA